MNFYPINVAPINGWATYQGSGQADMAMAAQGAGYAEMHTAGSIASMAQTATGSGIVAVLGSGSASQSMTASGIGYAKIFGSGQSNYLITAAGDGMVVPFMGGTALMALTASGNGKVSPSNIGYASLSMLARDYSANNIGAAGNGTAEMRFSGAYGIPTGKTLSASIDNVKWRLFVISDEHRVFKVSPDTQVGSRRKHDGAELKGIAMLGIVQKTPSDLLDYDIDFSEWITDSDTITTVIAEVIPSCGLTVASTSVSTPIVKAWLSGGVSGKSYEVKVTVSTLSGRVKTVCFKMRVKEC